ncbi:AB-hydrolase YheT, partial [Heliocybe sulcata]
AQTIYASLNACASETVVYERKVLRLPDGGVCTISLDFYPSLAEHPLCDDEPIVIALSGLTGGSDESYIIELMKGLRTRSSDGPSLRGVVCNFRGCAGTPLTTPRLYHGGTTDDLRCAILYLTTTFPNRRLFGVGFSLGSNLLVKYAGEEGESCPLSGIISLANIWDYVQGMKHIESGTWINRFFYQYVLGHSLRRLVRANLSAFTRPCTSSGPTLSTTEAPFTTTTSLLNPSRLHAFLTTLFIPFRTFIQLFTCDLHGFVNPEDYYAKVSCVRYLERVEVPCLAVNSMDDPFVPPDCLPLCQTLNSKWVVLAATEKGGHVGWIEKDGGRWYIRPAREFIHALLKVSHQGTSHLI